MKIRKIGLDPGFGNINLAEIQNKQMVERRLPSVVGIGTTDSGALTLAGIVRGSRRTSPHLVEFDSIDYLVGDGVANYAKPIERMDFGRFTDSPELRALLYAAMYRIINGGTHRIALAIGLPVEILQEKTQAAAIERDLAGWLVGSHRFIIDGDPAYLEVVKIRAKIAQPLATWFDWGLDLAGQWRQGSAAAKAPALIIDEGFNTLDLLVVEGGQISTRYTGGDTLGMRRAAEIAARNIDRKYGVEFSLHEADDLVQTVVAGKKASIYVDGQPTDVTASVRQALNTLASDVVRFVERSVGKGKKFKILVTGGGALALGARLLGQYPHAEIVPEPVLANARGLAKLAVRPGFLE